MIDKNKCEKNLRAGLAKMNIVLSDKKIQLLIAYLTEFVKWNKAYNLSAIRDPLAMVEKHLLDSLVLVPFLEKAIEKNQPTIQRIIDVGTGGGLPGIPLAICYPQAKFTLMDSIGKKIMVVEDMVNRLELSNTEVRRGRVEELPKKKTYDFVLGRAVTSLPVFFQWVRDKVAKGSRHSPANGILYLKGGDYTEELRASKLTPAKIWSLDELLPEAELGEKYLIHFKL